MFDKIYNIHKSLLRFALWIFFIGVFIALIIFSAYIGFFFSLAKCLNSSCNESEGLMVLIFPAGVFITGVYLFTLWSKRQRTKQLERIKTDIREEITGEQVNKNDSSAQKILFLIEKNPASTLDELLVQSGLEKEDVTDTLRVLLQQKIIKQEIQNGTAYFTLSR